MECCSSFGGTDFEVNVLDYSYYQGRYKITMKVFWRGKLSNSTYWIKGILRVDSDGCNPSWEKIDDSLGFPKECSVKCFNDCL